jgi:hypothetical protein
VYFDVVVNFRNVRISICKDLFNALVVDEINKTQPTYIEQYNRYNKGSVIAVIDKIVTEMFGGYFPDNLNISDKGRTTLDGVCVQLINRPSKLVYIDLIDLIYYFNDVKIMNSDTIKYYQYAVNRCIEYVNKYSKYKNAKAIIKRKSNYLDFFDEELVLILFNCLINKKDATSK